MGTRRGTGAQMLVMALALVVSTVAGAQSAPTSLSPPFSVPLLKPIPKHGPSGAAATAAAARAANAASVSAGVSSAAALAANNPRTPGGGTWQPLANQPNFLDEIECAGAANPLLLTDGSVIVQNGGCPSWWRLAPDARGSYVNGTWSQIASLPSGYSPLYHSSAVLPDGRVIIMGGEYNFFNPVWTNLGAIYDPHTDFWTPLAPPAGWTTIGDAQGVVLPNGMFMQANCCTSQAALLNSATLTWTATGTGKYDPNDEEGWTLLPSGQVLAVDAYVPIAPFPYLPNGTNSELYSPSTGHWHSAGSTRVQLWDSAAACGGLAVASFELGPGVLRPDGTVFYTGANSCGAGHTAIYDSYTGSWRPGPDFPEGLDIADGPAALLPNGHVLVNASPGIFNTPSYFFEWDGERLVPVPAPPNAVNDSSYVANMLVLPTGQILFTDFSDDVEIYTSPGHPDPAWAPSIVKAPDTLEPGCSYEIAGFLFNGMSQGAAYGDDVQAATNFPIVRITNRASGHVFFGRTHDHSSMAVANRGLVSTHFDVPATQERGPSDLVVIANGIASEPVFVLVR